MASIELPSNVGFGIVVGRFLQMVADGADLDQNPESIPMEGSVFFTPSTTVLVNRTALPVPVTLGSTPIQAKIDYEGYLTDMVGRRGVTLVATDDPDNNPTNWTYTVSFKLSTGTLPSFSMTVPMGTTVDLSTVIPVPSSPGIGVPQAIAAANLAEAAAQEALDLIQSGGGGGTGGLDHGNLTGLADDDHPQYLNNVRGDARYYTRALVDSALATQSTADRSRLNHTGTQTSATISDLVESVQDIVGAMFGTGTITSTYNDATGTITLNAPTGTASDPEAIRDAIGAAIVGIGAITVTVNDALDTITISTTATTNSTDAQLRDRATHTGTQAISTITGLQAALNTAAGGSMRTVYTEGIDLTGVTDVAPALQTVLNSMRPGEVFGLLPRADGQEAVLSVGSTINVPSGVSIVGPAGGASIWGYQSGFPVRIEARAGFVGSAIFRMDATTTAVQDVYMANFAIHGQNRGTAVHAIDAIGPVINVELDHITIRNMTGDGLHVAPNTTAFAKGWRINRVMSESHVGWSFYIDGLTDSNITQSHAHTSSLGGFYLAGLGDTKITDARSTWVGGPGLRTADSVLAGRPWGNDVQINGFSTDRSNGPGIVHGAHNINPISFGITSLGRDQRNGGVVDNTLAAVLVDGGATPAGLINFAKLDTYVGYDDTVQDDTFSSPGWAISALNSRGITVGGGTLWGTAGQWKLTGTTAYVSVAPTTTMMTGTRNAPVYLGVRAPGSRFSTTSASTQGINTAGDRTFTVTAGLDFGPGMVVRAASTLNPTTVYIEGPVKSYVGTTLVIDGTATRVGTGSPTSWTIYATAFAGQALVDSLRTDTTAALATKATYLGVGVTISGRIIVSNTSTPAGMTTGDLVVVVP